MKRLALVACLLSVSLARADQTVSFSKGDCKSGWTVTVSGKGSSSVIVGDQCQLAQTEAATEWRGATASAKTQCEARGGAFGPPSAIRHIPEEGKCRSYTLSEEHEDYTAHYCKCLGAKTGAALPPAAPVDALAVDNRDGLPMQGQSALPTATSPLILKAPAIEMR